MTATRESHSFKSRSIYCIQYFSHGKLGDILEEPKQCGGNPGEAAASILMICLAKMMIVGNE